MHGRSTVSDANRYIVEIEHCRMEFAFLIAYAGLNTGQTHMKSMTLSGAPQGRICALAAIPAFKPDASR
ncbi:hypothetical protein [Caballeronia choica]|jgi:hypothetical protein|uniref:hypothetical protein n=1 Tax=Caballeronia choica TaxID=326476 RepID=UPI000AC5FA60|nr:hypothetical protein [Caballeronia choica]